VISVLLVDDHPVVVEGLRKLLTQTGEVVIAAEANDAATGIKLARQIQPDVVLLDLRMPGATGIQAVRRMREQEVRSAVIILTSYADDDLLMDAVAVGAIGYVLKQIGSDDLVRHRLQGARGGAA